MISNAPDTLFSQLFTPQSVVFVGASETPAKWGFTILMHILQGGYAGRLYLINPKHATVLGRPCFKRIAELPETPDLAILVVPAAQLLSAVEDCVARGIKAAVVITSGFAEIGEEGKRLQERLVAVAREGGLHFVGPNSMGLYSGTPSRLVSIMASIIPDPGPAAVLSQSGNLGVSLMSRLNRRGVGLSRVVSVGNEASLSIADYLLLLKDDPQTKVISVYAEGASAGRGFLEAIEETSRVKPVVLIKGGRSELGNRAVKSHTAALSGSYDVFAASVREAGAILVDSMDEAVNVVGALCSQPLPKGRRLAIVTYGGGWGVLATDACARYGIALPELPPEVERAIGKNLPDFWSHANPIDLVATNKPEVIPEILESLLASEAYDGVLYLGLGYIMHVGLQYTKPLPDPQPAISPALVGEYLIDIEYRLAETLATLPKKYNKPLLCVADLVVREDELPNNSVKHLESLGLYVYSSPNEAAQVFDTLASRYERESAASQTAAPEFAAVPAALGAAKAAIAAGAARSHRQLSEHESKLVLAALGIPATPEIEAHDEAGVLAAAGTLGYPLVLKLSSADVLHKTEAGGVILDLRDEAALLTAAAKLLPRGPVLVQKMAEKARVELLVGLSHDPCFGPVITFGRGGIETEIWRDSDVLPAPLSREQAGALIARTKVSKLIGPFRKQAPLDHEALVEFLMRVSRLPSLFPEIKELDINPLFLYERGALALDAAIVLHG